jgi:hypothetical protein
MHPSCHYTNYNSSCLHSATESPTETKINTKNNDDAIVNSCAFITTAALALWAASGKDARLSSYSVKRAPVYGSNERALKASNALEYLSVGIAVLIYTVKYFPVIDAIVDYQAAISYPPDNARQYAAVGYPPGYIRQYIAANYLLYSDNQCIAGIYYPVNFPIAIDCPINYQPGAGDPSGYTFRPAHPPSAVDIGKALIISGAATSTVTEMLKKHAARPRPDLSDSLSYPSGHATAAACANHASARMISGLGLPPYMAYPAYAALSLLTLGTAWGRVEGGRHYPGDVMAGMYVGMAFTDAPFALYGGGDNPLGIRFVVGASNEREPTAAVLSTTINF